MRATNRRRSKASSDMDASPWPMKICTWSGSVGRTLTPREELSVGTSRQPMRVRPSSAITRSKVSRTICFPAASRGMKIWPTAYWPGAGSVKPRRAASFAKKRWGIWTSMPAPSPARGSAPTAPRCSRLSRIWIPSSMILWDLRPLMSAMKPTPQASRSWAGSNRPEAAGRPAMGAVLAAVAPATTPALTLSMRSVDIAAPSPFAGLTPAIRLPYAPPGAFRGTQRRTSVRRMHAHEPRNVRMIGKHDCPISRNMTEKLHAHKAVALRRTRTSLRKLRRRALLRNNGTADALSTQRCCGAAQLPRGRAQGQPRTSLGWQHHPPAVLRPQT